jgi:hypothetical protein
MAVCCQHTTVQQVGCALALKGVQQHSGSPCCLITGICKQTSESKGYRHVGTRQLACARCHSQAHGMGTLPLAETKTSGTPATATQTFVVLRDDLAACMGTYAACQRHRGQLERPSSWSLELCAQQWRKGHTLFQALHMIAGRTHYSLDNKFQMFGSALGLEGCFGVLRTGLGDERSRAVDAHSPKQANAYHEGLRFLKLDFYYRVPAARLICCNGACVTQVQALGPSQR